MSVSVIRGNFIPCLFLMSFLLFYQWSGISYGNDSSPSGPEYLFDKYHEIEKELDKKSDPVPFYIESAINKNACHVDIYASMKDSFDMVQKELLLPANWCDILLPHFNIRACTYKKVDDTWLLNIYNVMKSSEPIEDAYQMKFIYRLSALRHGYFDIGLTAREGPAHTKDYQFGLEAMQLEKNKTLIHLYYSFGYSAWRYFFMKMFGGSKVGFTVTGRDNAGNPVYVEGLRGSAERNVVCYCFAIAAYLDTLNTPSDQRFERRISEWYDLTALFKKQLFRMSKEDYLKYKIQDLKSQEKLQADLNR